jgi:putative nucleotidyltransferase with HDIG domain
MNDSEIIYSASKKIQVDVKDLKLGMYVCELDRPWLDTPFWFQGFVLKSDADIKAVREHCNYVYIDVEKMNLNPTLVVSAGTAYTKAWLDKKGKPPEKKLSFQEEILTAQEIHLSGSNLIRSFIDDVRLGRGVSTEAAKAVVAKAVESILRTPDALMWMTQLKHRDEYTAQHCLNVCILAIALGRHVGLSVEELNHVGLCGMLHDLGKIRVPLGILNKPGKLEADEIQIMRDHTVMGMKLLMSSRNMYGGVIDVAHAHHERLDGKGYPRKLNDTGITPYTRMISIVDTYDAMTSDRVYQNGKPHLDAIKGMADAAGTQLDSDLAIRFIECIGIYPCGSVVELNNGEVGIVVELNSKHKLKPKIITLLDQNKQPMPERLLDLSLNLDDAGRPITIKKTIRADDYHIDINKYYENFAQGKNSDAEKIAGI